MKYIVFTRNSYNITPIDIWLKEYTKDIIIITKKEHEQEYSKIFKTIGLDNYDSDKDKIEIVRKLNEIHNITHIAGLSEFDLIGVSKSREAINLTGQKTLSAIVFRNKLVMKKYVSSCGVSVAKYRCVKNKEEIKKFVEINGFPIILKPLDGGGSQNTIKICSHHELDSLQNSYFSRPMLVEEFINGEMIHLDGILESGKISLLSISKYVGSCLFSKKGETLGSYQIQKNTKLWRDANDFLIKVLSSLPCPEVTAFHAEFFVKLNGELVFCEIASRLGGARVIDSINASFRIDIVGYWLKKQLGINVQRIPNEIFSSYYGYFVITPKEGVLKYLPESIPFEWIKEFRQNCSIGDNYNAGKNYMEELVSYLVAGESEEQVKNRIIESCHWFEENILYE